MENKTEYPLCMIGVQVNQLCFQAEQYALSLEEQSKFNKNNYDYSSFQDNLRKSDMSIRTLQHF